MKELFNEIKLNEEKKKQVLREILKINREIEKEIEVEDIYRQELKPKKKASGRVKMLLNMAAGAAIVILIAGGIYAGRFIYKKQSVSSSFTEQPNINENTKTFYKDIMIDELGIKVSINEKIFTESEYNDGVLTLKADDYTSTTGKTVPVYFSIYKEKGTVENLYNKIYYKNNDEKLQWDRTSIGLNGISYNYIVGKKEAAFNGDTGEYVTYYIFEENNNNSEYVYVMETHDYGLWLGNAVYETVFTNVLNSVRIIN